MVSTQTCAIPTLRPRSPRPATAFSSASSLQAAAAFRLGPWRLSVRSTGVDFGVIVDGVVAAADADRDLVAPADIVSAVFMENDDAKAAFFALVDVCGLVIVENVVTTDDLAAVAAATSAPIAGDVGAAAVAPDPAYVEVRGRSSRGKLSPGEFYHHDGCSGPVRPRVVEIRCPHQEVARTVATAVAPFPATVYAMLRCLPAPHRTQGELARWHDELVSTGAIDETHWDLVQGALNRVLRHLPAEYTRAYFRDVDAAAGAYVAPWRMGESRFIANENPQRTTQHRRAYQSPVSSSPTGKLAKRWPAEALQPGD